jgi:CDP-glucose 4,6-dehydratase
MGTIHVMEAIRYTDSVKTGVLITTDKVYENKEVYEGYKETDPFGGYDPYSSSKGACEIAISSWRRSFMNPNEYSKHGKAIASARAGNVIGGGDFADKRIVPDCIKAIEAGETIEIRSPGAVRPWQHVLEPLSGYLLLGMKLHMEPTKYAEGFNFGPLEDSVVPVWEFSEELIRLYGKGMLKDISDPNALHEAKLLMLNIDKAEKVLDWKPKWNFKDTMFYTVDWYKRYQNENVYELCVEHIKSYMEKS